MMSRFESSECPRAPGPGGDHELEPGSQLFTTESRHESVAAGPGRHSGAAWNRRAEGTKKARRTLAAGPADSGDATSEVLPVPVARAGRCRRRAGSLRDSDNPDGR